MHGFNDYSGYAAFARSAGGAPSSSSSSAAAVPPPPPPPPPATQRGTDFAVEKNAADYLHNHFTHKAKQDQGLAIAAQQQQQQMDPFLAALTSPLYSPSLDDFAWKQQAHQQYLAPTTASFYGGEPAYSYGYDWYSAGGDPQQQQQQPAMQQYYYQQQQPQLSTRGGQPSYFLDDTELRHVSPPLSTKRIGFGEEDCVTKKRSRGTKRSASAAAAAPPPPAADGAFVTADGVIPMRSFPVSIHGETRLNIKFISLGEPGVVVQRFGKHNCAIPNGLSGTHQMYDQRWRFEVHHVIQGPTTLIRFDITNLTSGTVTSVTETIQDAMVRETCGRTICNNVLKNALEIRAVELENSVEVIEASNPTRAANIRNLIKVLRPKRCTVGLLFFGLLHECVQTNHERMLLGRKGLQCVVHAPPPPAGAAPGADVPPAGAAPGEDVPPAEVPA